MINTPTRSSFINDIDIKCIYSSLGEYVEKMTPMGLESINMEKLRSLSSIVYMVVDKSFKTSSGLYVIDLSFSGGKSSIYTTIEKDLRPMIRDRSLGCLLEGDKG